MICKHCGHYADDHTMAGAMEPKYCVIVECQCHGWSRKMDKAEDFLPEDAKLREVMKQLEPEYIIEWDEDGRPHKVRRKD